MDINLIDNIINIDCIEFLKKQNEKLFDHVITDIPYNVVSRKSAGIRVFDKFEADELVFDLNTFCQKISDTTKGNILVFCASEQVSELSLKFSNLGYKVFLGIWEKTNPSPVNGQHFWLSGIECCVIATKEDMEPNKLIWKFPSGRSKEHPTEKPIKLLEFLVENFSKENELIYDPCAGSGTHLLAIKNKNRKYFGTELFEKYYNLIKNKGL